MTSIRLAQSFPSLLAFLHHHLLTPADPPQPTTILVAGTKAAFCDALGSSALRSRAAHSPDLDPCFAPTFANLARSSRTHLLYVPTLPHLRACLAAYECEREHEHEPSLAAVGQKRRLVLLNTLALHRATSEWSAQGLARTLAAAVDVGCDLRMEVLVAECADGGGGTDDDTPLDGEGPRGGLWSERLPILSGTISEWEDEVASASAPMATVGEVVGKWFRVEVDGDREASSADPVDPMDRA